MKIITFINYAYVDIAYNLYLQLKCFNRHKDFIVFCSDEETRLKFIERSHECIVTTYKPMLLQQYSNRFEHYIKNKEFAATHNKSTSYSIYQFLKHDCLYQSVLEYNEICLLDADTIIFEDFVDELLYWMNNTRRFIYGIPSEIGIKYYLNIRSGVDISKPESLYKWLGKEQIVNTGFMYVHKSENSLNHIKNYSNLFPAHFDQLYNIDEWIITEYFRNIIDNTTSISDQINLVSNAGIIYTPQQVLKIKPMTFHPTFTHDKVQFFKDCNHWLLD